MNPPSDGLFDILIRSMPLWVIGVTLLLVCLLALEGGRLIYRRTAASGAETAPPQKADADGHIIASIFGLLAFVLGLTFSIALDRYDDRRTIVAEEANAISTAYLRASLLDDSDRIQLQNLLRRYAHSRLAPDTLWGAQMDLRVEKVRLLRLELWDATHVAVYPIRSTDLASSFVESINAVFDVGTRRELAGRAQIPTRILEVLMIYLFASAAVLGFLIGDSSMGRRASAIFLLLLFVVLITMIIDLDRPRSGQIFVSQRALEDLITMVDHDARLHLK